MSASQEATSAAPSTRKDLVALINSSRKGEIVVAVRVVGLRFGRVWIGGIFKAAIDLCLFLYFFLYFDHVLLV